MIRRWLVGRTFRALSIAATLALPASGAQARQQPSARQAEQAIRSAIRTMYEVYSKAGQSVSPKSRCNELVGEDCFGGQRECPHCFWQPDTLEMRELGKLYDQTGDFVRRARAGTDARLLNWLAGQRVGTWAHAGYLANAMRAAEECVAVEYWCLALMAYVEHLYGWFEKSEARFRFLLETMPVDIACAWSDTEFYLDSLAFAIGRGRTGPCLPIELIESFWAPADPLFTLPGNDRFTEHFARQVDIEIHRHWLEAIRHELLPEDEQTMLIAGSPDPGIRNGVHDSEHHSLLVRYGWPTGIEVGGRIRMRLFEQRPRGMFRAQPGVMLPRPTSGLLNVRPVYGKGQGFIPEVTPAVALTGPPEMHEPESRRPRETYRPRYGPVEPMSLQTGFFRRDGAPVLLVRSATPLVRVPSSDKWKFGYWDGTGFGEAAVDVRDDTLIVWHETDWKPQIVSLEAMHGEGAWRARTGTKPPEPGRNAIISSVILMRSRSDHPKDLAEAARRALPTTHIRPNLAVAAYWELYVPEKRNAAVDVIVRRVDEPGILGRIFGGGTPPERRIRWEEEMEPVNGVAPRAVDLDLGALPSGNYEIEVTMVLNDGDVLRSTSRFWIDG